MVFPDISSQKRTNQEVKRKQTKNKINKTNKMKATKKEKHFGNSGCAGAWCFWLLVSLSAWPGMKEVQGALHQLNKARPGQERPTTEVENRLERRRKAGVNWNEHKHSNTHILIVPFGASKLLCAGELREASESLGSILLWAADPKSTECGCLAQSAGSAANTQPGTRELLSKHWAPCSRYQHAHTNTLMHTKGACLVIGMHGMLTDSVLPWKQTKVQPSPWKLQLKLYQNI